MGKSKKNRVGFATKQNLGDQIMEGRIVKNKTRNKVRLRADEDQEVLFFLISSISFDSFI